MRATLVIPASSASIIRRVKRTGLALMEQLFHPKKRKKPNLGKQKNKNGAKARERNCYKLL